MVTGDHVNFVENYLNNALIGELFLSFRYILQNSKNLLFE
jgi:hypothetical protein